MRTDTFELIIYQETILW